MKITKHITFHYLETRVTYINTIINETNQYKIPTDIFIHTNKLDMDINYFIPYTNGSIRIIHHDMTNKDPFSLAIECRSLLRDQKDDYDIFMYIEDDMLVPYTAIEYWLKYHNFLLKYNYNLGFVRIETKNGEEYITDLRGNNEKMKRFVKLNNLIFCLNDTNPYCAFWIYSKNEFKQFVDSIYYDVSNIKGCYGIREASAVGLHGIDTKWFNGTLIPMVNKGIIPSCRIYHMANNYVTDNSNKYATVRFNDCINFNGFAVPRKTNLHKMLGNKYHG